MKKPLVLFRVLGYPELISAYGYMAGDTWRLMGLVNHSAPGS